MNYKKKIEEVYALLEEYNIFLEEIPLKDEKGQKIDYLKNIYVTYAIKGANDGIYKDVNDLEVQIITNKKNKIEANNLADVINGKLDKAILSKGRINKKNAWKISFDDEEDKTNIVLQYDLNTY